MQTKNYVNANAKTVKRTLNQKALVPTKAGSFRQEVMMSQFKHQDRKTGGKSDVEIDFTQTFDLELEKAWLIRLKTLTSDTTNHPTFMSDILPAIRSIELRCNDSQKTWKYEKDFELALLKNERLKEFGDRLFEKRAESDNEFNGLSGVQVTNTTPQYFYINLFDLFPQFKDQCLHGIIPKIRIIIEFKDEPESAKDAVMICKSNTTSNAFTKDKMTFTDIEFLRVYEIVKDISMLSIPPLDLVRFDIPAFEHEEYPMAGTLGEKKSVNIADVFKLNNFKKIFAWYVPDAVAYNDATAGMRYSGNAYLNWAIEEKNGGTNRKKLSFLSDTIDNKRRLRNYEIERHRKTYGNDLPISVHANTDNWNKYFLFMTEIYFDEVENSDNTYETFPDYNSHTKDYTITFELAAALGAGTIHLCAMKNEFYKIDPKTLKIYEVADCQ